MRFLGVDLAWGLGTDERPANESGVVALEEDGRIVAAGWTRGLEETLAWIEEQAADETLLFVDAPLLILNRSGKRECEREVSHRYGAAGVSANSSSQEGRFVADACGVHLLPALRARGWEYDDRSGRATGSLRISECYPYATLAGASELGYATAKAPRKPDYKRQPKVSRQRWLQLGLPGDPPAEKRGLPAPLWQPARAAICDELIRRIAALAGGAVPIDLRSHPATSVLLDEPSPLGNSAYKHREDLIDAALCAWTAALAHAAPERIVALGQGDPLRDQWGDRAVIVAPRPPSADAPGPAPATEPRQPVQWVDAITTREPKAHAAGATNRAPVAPAATPSPSRAPAAAAAPSMSWTRARAYVEAIPAGRWASYGDVAAHAGNPRGGQALGQWLAKQGVVPGMHRVLRSDGGVSGGWAPGAVEHPTTREEAVAQLVSEGLRFDAQGRAAQQQRWRPAP